MSSLNISQRVPSIFAIYRRKNLHFVCKMLAKRLYWYSCFVKSCWVKCVAIEELKTQIDA